MLELVAACNELAGDVQEQILDAWARKNERVSFTRYGLDRSYARDEP